MNSTPVDSITRAFSPRFFKGTSSSALHASTNAVPMPLEHLPRRCEPRPRPTAHHSFFVFPKRLMSGCISLVPRSSSITLQENCGPRPSLMRCLAVHTSTSHSIAPFYYAQHARHNVSLFQIVSLCLFVQTKPCFHAIATVRSGCALRLCVCVCMCVCVHVCASLRARLRATVLELATDLPVESFFSIF